MKSINDRLVLAIRLKKLLDAYIQIEMIEETKKEATEKAVLGEYEKRDQSNSGGQ